MWLLHLGWSRQVLTQPSQAASTLLQGQVVDQLTHRPLSFSSLSLLRQPVGTVADVAGRFELVGGTGHEADSLCVSLVGYAARTLLVAEWRRQLALTGGLIALHPQPVGLPSAQVTGHHLVRRVVGNASDSNRLFYWLNDNSPGNQIGEFIPVKRPSWLDAISFHVAVCSYDSLFLRINVYALRAGFPTRLLLPGPLYVRLARTQLRDRVVVDLRPYHLWLPDNVVVALEILRPLGPGTLCFSASHDQGPLYFIDKPGDGRNRNTPPRGTLNRRERWESPGPGSEWHKFSFAGVGITASLSQEPR
jgi:hypothetical protein